MYSSTVSIWKASAEAETDLFSVAPQGDSPPRGAAPHTLHISVGTEFTLLWSLGG